MSTVGFGALFGAGLFGLPFLTLGQPGILLGGVGLLPAFLMFSMMAGVLLQTIRAVDIGVHASDDPFDATRLLTDIFETASMGLALILAVAWPYLAALATGIADRVPSWAFVAWVMIYYPLALTVAARSRQFFLTVNPLAGITAIREFGSRAPSLLVMNVVTLLAVGYPLYRFLRYLLKPESFYLPVFLVIGVAVGPFIFAANITIACLVGRALFKSNVSFT